MDTILDVYIVTFNCGRNPVDYDYFATHLFRPYRAHDAGKLPDVIVLSLQELAPVADSLWGGTSLNPYFARFVEAVRLASDSHGQYQQIATHNAGMTGIAMFAKSDIRHNFRWIELGDVGVGYLGIGNKGAAAIRVGYAASDEATPLTFVAAHLAAMENALERRNADWESIVRRLGFRQHGGRNALNSTYRSDASRGGENQPLLGRQDALFTNESPVFFAGDLNYRTNDKGPGVQDYARFPQPSDNVDDSRHFSRLLPQDQLKREQQAGKTLHSLSEEEIKFPPTYKFSDEQQMQIREGVLVDDTTPDSWMWSKHRWPSWCDRILFSSYLVSSDIFQALDYLALPLQPTSDHRPVALRFKLNLGALKRADLIQEAPFPLDADWQRQRMMAKQLEMGVAYLSYLGLTWEGNGLVLATVVGAVGGWLVIRSLVGA